MEGNKKPLMGVVVNCMNLNIRKDPTQASRSLGIIGSDTVVKVCNDESVSGFYKVKTVDGISGYCMSEFIKLFVGYAFAEIVGIIGFSDAKAERQNRYVSFFRGFFA